MIWTSPRAPRFRIGRRVHGAAGLAVAGILLTGACSVAPPNTAAIAPAPRPGETVPWPAGLPASDQVRCPGATVEVMTSGDLTTALRAAEPGTVIVLADGTYDGTFTAAASGTAQEPIWLCGSPNAVLRGPGPDAGTVLHLQQVAHWRLVGFTVRAGKKGVMADGVSASMLQDLTVTEIGDEAVHLRSASTGNVVRGLTISGTGQRVEKFGEGIYVGSAVSNWCEISGCAPDRSDRNVLVANTISDTTAESIDLKEGTTGGVVHGNTFDGSGMRGKADSWIDVKGNGWLIQANRGTSAATSGFEVNEQAEGWGIGNTFDANTADVQGPGYGYELRPIADNRVTCTNRVTGAAKGLTNTDCV